MPISKRLLTRSFRYFYGYAPTKLWLVFGLTLLLGLNQGVSVVMLIPLLSLLDRNALPSGQGKVVEWVNETTHNLGLTLNIEVILVAFVAVLVLTTLISYFKSTLQSCYEQGFVYSIRSRLFKKVSACDWITLNAKSKHTHIQVLSNEIPKFITYYFAMVNLFSSAIIILAHVVIALMVSVKFTLLVLLVGTAALLSLRKFFGRSFTLGGANIGVFRKMLKQLDDFWIMVKSAKVHNAERYYHQQYDKTCRLMLELQQKQAVNRARSQLLFTLAGVLGLLLIIYVGYRIDNLPMTSIFVMILLFGRLFPLLSAANGFVDIIASNIQSVKMVIDADEQLPEASFMEVEPSSVVNFSGDVQVVNLNFSYNKSTPIFERFNAVFTAGQITGVLGQSGGGKTTLIDIIAGLLKPDAGLIRVGNTTLSDENVAQWKESLGYLPQDSFFIDGTIRENLVWDSPYSITDERIFEILNRVNAKTIVEREPQGLHTPISNFQYHFSGGERQRLALARVLLRFPKVLLLDEATSALDENTEQQIMKTLVQLKNELTIILVTHRQNLRSYFDHTIYINHIETGGNKTCDDYSFPFRQPVVK
jgi:ABC-type multidrug transport system, ATPase and permease components